MDTISEIQQSIETLTCAVDDLRSFRFQEARLFFDEVRKQLHTIEQRLARMEASHGAIDKRNDVPTGVQDSVDRSLPKLSGKMTLAEVAVQAGLPGDHATLIRIGRYLRLLGLRRGRTGEKRYYWFL